MFLKVISFDGTEQLLNIDRISIIRIIKYDEVYSFRVQMVTEYHEQIFSDIFNTENDVMDYLSDNLKELFNRFIKLNEVNSEISSDNLVMTFCNKKHIEKVVYDLNKQYFQFYSSQWYSEVSSCPFDNYENAKKWLVQVIV